MNNSSFIEFLVEYDLSLPFEFNYKYRDGDVAIMNVYTVNGYTPDISHLTDFINEVSNDRNYNIMIDNSELEIICNENTAKNIIRTQNNLFKRTAIIENDEDFMNCLEIERYNEEQIERIENDFSY